MRILYLDLDTLRPDHLGCYGYHRETSPNIDWIANQAVRYENYYCSDAPCLPSRTALMTGRFGIHTGVVNHGGTNADMRTEGSKRWFRDNLYNTSLPGFLNTKLDMKTVSISGFAKRHTSWTFNAGFSEIYDTGKMGDESAEDVTPTALKWIKSNAKDDNWFLQLNYWDAHTPYRAPKEFGNPFKDEPLPAWLTEDVLKKHQNKVGPHCAKEITMYDNVTNPEFPRQPGEVTNMDELRNLIDGYDCGVRYMDEHIGTILDALKKEGVLDDLVIIVSADHAENMGELGIYAEHATADYINCRIPMIVRWPGNTDEGRVDNALHYNLDLAPTLAEMFEQEPASIWDGKSFASSITKNEESGYDYLVISQCAHVCQRGVRFGDWMYIRTYHDGYHLFPKEMLFNIKDDYHEQNNLAEDRRDICKEAVYLLNEWHDEMMSSMEDDTDPLWTVIKEGGPLHANGALEKYCEYLQKTGRDWAIPELKIKHPKEFKNQKI